MVCQLLQKKNLVIPPRMPAKTNGRRRATLIITPASLISHWLAQIEEHVDKGVDLNIMVHHGTSKRFVLFCLICLMINACNTKTWSILAC